MLRGLLCHDLRMGVNDPSAINAAFARGFNDRDVDGLLGLYDVDGGVVERDGSLSVGHAAVREHLTQLVGLGGTMVSTNLTSVVVGDIALITAEWTISDSPVIGSATGHSSEVLRRQTDGSWAYLIDQPT